MRLKKWTAKRSGAAITVTGIDIETDQEATITGIETIQIAEPGEGDIIVATTKKGEAHSLLPLAI